MVLAQTGRVKHIEGALWFAPSDREGGYLVNVETGTCTCPDGQRGKCKHVWAVEYAQGAGETAQDGAALAKRADKPVWPRGDMTPQEIANVRAALRFLQVRCGGWDALGKAIRARGGTLAYQMTKQAPTGGLAIRLARFAGVPVDDVLNGRFPVPGTCPHCGHCPAEGPKLHSVP